MAKGDKNELVMLPLGGVGEIGMNLMLYGLGRKHDRQWLAVDFGVAFAHADLPGVDLVFPDISFLEEERTNLAGIVITHAHEDHFGALLDLWPRLRVPVYATAFTAGLLAAKAASEPGAQMVPVTVVKPGDRIKVGLFEVEYINVAHSIPESHALAIRTPLGTVLHTGDWKLDDTPTLGDPTDARRLKAIGEEGVLALVCDSTNAMREGRSASEAEVQRELIDIVKHATGRVAFTTFASNVGRIRSIALAAQAAGRNVVISGRALRRAIDVASELNMLDGLPAFLDEDSYAHLPRDKVVVVLTGSQGEPRASLARVAVDDHPRIELVPGDLVVFSARAIPGNELEINRIINALSARGIRVMTDRDRLVHVSGHPRRGELTEMYAWTKPKIAVPVHGEPMHLAAHADLARELGVPTVITIKDGGVTRLAPEPVAQVDKIELGRLYKDGNLIGDIDGVGVSERRKLSFAGHVAVSLVVDRKGEAMADPDVALTGLPMKDAAGRPFEETVMNTVLGTMDSLPRPQKRDPDVLAEAVRRAVRAAVVLAWGKKPICTVFVAVV
ncbi:MAG TPA: ribonuclease J [Bauldia sp.]|nr:ribonuclease J [Bauldia sp.]